MRLPTLPKLRKHIESDITPAVRQWFKDNYKENSYALEIKIKGGRLKKHQPAALKQVDSGFFDYKINDRGARNPFDVIGLRGADAFIVYVDKKKCTVYSYDMIEQFKFEL